MKISLPKQEFTNIEIGENQLFKVTTAAYNEETHTLRVTYRDKAGNTNSEFFRLETREAKDKPYEPNPQALKRFATLYRGITGNRDTDDADPEDLVGCFFTADVKLGSEKDDGSHWLNVWSKRPSDLTFDDVPDKPKKDDEDEW